MGLARRGREVPALWWLRGLAEPLAAAGGGGIIGRDREGTSAGERNKVGETGVGGMEMVELVIGDDEAAPGEHESEGSGEQPQSTGLPPYSAVMLEKSSGDNPNSASEPGKRLGDGCSSSIPNPTNAVLSRYACSSSSRLESKSTPAGSSLLDQFIVGSLVGIPVYESTEDIIVAS